jgi:hypothetical protein
VSVNEEISEGSVKLWGFTQKLIQLAVHEGFFTKS